MSIFGNYNLVYSIFCKLTYLANKKQVFEMLRFISSDQLVDCHLQVIFPALLKAQNMALFYKKRVAKFEWVRYFVDYLLYAPLTWLVVVEGNVKVWYLVINLKGSGHYS